MARLKVTLIDVGWGDSILIESTGPARDHYALIDSNDEEKKDVLMSRTFLRKHFGLSTGNLAAAKPIFDFVMLSHDHSDHGSGLKYIMKKYGTRHFWHPKVNIEDSSVLSNLLSYVRHGRVQIDHEAFDNVYTPDLMLGDTSMSVLWPPPDYIDVDDDPNRNSIVVALSLGGVSFLLTGDAEGNVWDQISGQIPANTRVIKVPHHGSRNGTIHHGATPWVDAVEGFQSPPHLGISCHHNYPNKYDFPHAEVIARFDSGPCQYYRTDLHYHITFTYDTTVGDVTVSYSHV